MSYKTGFYWRRNGMAGAFAFERFDSGCFQPPIHREVCFLPGFSKCRSERNRKVQYDGKIKGNGTKCMIIGVKCREDTAGLEIPVCTLLLESTIINADRECFFIAILHISRRLPVK